MDGYVIQNCFIGDITIYIYIYIYFTSNIFNALITNITMEEEIAWVIKRLQNNRLKILGVEKFKFLCK